MDEYRRPLIFISCIVISLVICFDLSGAKHHNSNPITILIFSGPLASALNNGMQQRPSFPNSMAIQVRQSLLQQQKLKQQRELEKRWQAQEQARRRVLMQQQLSNNFRQRFQPVSFYDINFSSVYVCTFICNSTNH